MVGWVQSFAQLGPKQSLKRKLLFWLVREWIMSQIRRRHFLITSPKSLGLTVLQGVLLRGIKVIE